MILLAIAHVTAEKDTIWKYQQEEKSKQKLNKKTPNKTTTKTKLPPTVTAWVIMTMLEEDTQEDTFGEVK